ncbi:MAG: hypothetical protein KAS32_21655 [Candidatus Peribacteraceae bacterium]|nr:hypothetical protein [Candidatus Peribacteraceae bacterium]
MEKIKTLKNDFSELSIPAYIKKYWKLVILVIVCFFVITSYGGYNGYARVGNYFQEKFETMQEEMIQDYEDKLNARMEEINTLKGKISNLEEESSKQKGKIVELEKKKTNIKTPITVEEIIKRLKELGYDAKAIPIS